MFSLFSFGSKTSRNFKPKNKVDPLILSNTSYKEKENCSNAKGKFFTEDMEFVSELDFSDPNNQLKASIKENHKSQNGIWDRSTKIVESVNENHKTDLKLDKKRLTDEFIAEKQRCMLEEEKKELKLKKKNLISKILTFQRDINKSNQEIDMLENYGKYTNYSLATEGNLTNTNDSSSDFFYKPMRGITFNEPELSFNGSGSNSPRKFFKLQTMNAIPSNNSGPIKGIKKQKSKLTLSNASAITTEESQANALEMRAILQKQEIKRQMKSKIYKDQIILQKEEISKLREMVNSIDEQVASLEKEIYRITEQLNIYYHELLELGKDCRKEGLSWIIKAIWNLGCDVRMSQMPSFLDKDAIIYLLKFANYGLQHDILKKHCEDLRLGLALKNSKNEKSKVLFTKKQTIRRTFRQDTLKELQTPIPQTEELDRLKNAYKTFLSNVSYAKKNSNYVESFYPDIVFKSYSNIIDEGIEDPKILESYIQHYHEKLISYPKEKTKVLGGWGSKAVQVNKANLIKEVLDKKTNLDNETKKSYGNLNNLQETRELIKKKMSSIRTQEISRLSKEILMNDYLRRFNIGQNQLFSAVVGEEQSQIVISQYNTEHQIYSQKKKEIETFNVLKTRSRNHQETIANKGLI